jgi:uncharacterized damage-inducible protein DinB
MTPETAKSLAQFVLPQIEQEFATSRRVLAAVPNDQGSYKPSEKCMTALELAIHIAAAEVFFLSGVVKGGFDWKQPDLKTPADVLAYYEETVPPLLKQVAEASGETLSKNIAFAKWNHEAVNYLSLHLRHTIHHRGQLSAYLRPMGAKVPSIYGPSADDPGQTASA